MDKRYNGWVNYETWLCNLWMTNDYGSYSYFKEMAQQAENIYDLSEMIKDDFYNSMPEMEPNFFYDLITAGLSEVCWYEIAENIWNEAHDQDEDEDADNVEIETNKYGRKVIRMKHDNGHEGSAEIAWIEDDGYNAPHYVAFIYVPFHDMKKTFLGNCTEENAIEKAEHELEYALSCCEMI